MAVCGFVLVNALTPREFTTRDYVYTKTILSVYFTYRSIAGYLPLSRSVVLHDILLY